MPKRKRKKRQYYSEYPEEPYRWWEDEYQHTFRGLMNQYDRYTQPTPMELKDYEPRRIKHVVFDADDTLWDIEPFGLASLCKPPAKEIGKDKFEIQCHKLTVTRDEKGEMVSASEVDSPALVTLRPGMVETIDKIRSKGIGTSIASNNDPDTVENLIRAIGLRDKFDVIISDFDTKDILVQKISKEVDAEPEEMIFVDDAPYNVHAVDKLGALSLCIDRDIFSPEELLRFIQEVE